MTVSEFYLILIAVSRMMQGFGECSEPRDDTIELMETYVYEFINNLVHRSLARSQRAGFAQIQMRDLLKVIEADEKKFLRVPYIITGLEMTKKTAGVKDGLGFKEGLIGGLGEGEDDEEGQRGGRGRKQ